MPARTEPVPLPAPVTGVARGNLGTATNLDDTQVYRLDELRPPGLVQVAEHEPQHDPRREPQPPSDPMPPHDPISLPRPRRRTGLIAAGVTAAVLALAVGLSLRDGATFGPGGAGQGTGGAADAWPSDAAATDAPVATAPTEASGGGNGGGNGRGGGNGGGNGRGGGNGNH